MSDSERARRSGDAAQAERPKVLILDDHPAVLSVLGRVLREHGYQPLTSTSVDNATYVLTTTSVAAVILDVKLSGGNSGLELLPRVRQEPLLARLPTIVMTGAPLSTADQQAIARHGAYLLHKPEGVTALVGFLNRLTDTGSSAP